MQRLIENMATGEVALDVIAPDVPIRSVRITESPFLIGRGNANQLQLSDVRISRSAAAICFEDSHYLEDRGQRGGMYVNGKKISKHPLQDGDVITFGADASCQLIFRASSCNTSVDHLLSRMENITQTDSRPGGLGKINLLLEATMLLHAQLPLDAILGTMVDHAIAITDAERGLLLEATPTGTLRARVARGGKGIAIPVEGLSASQTAIALATQRRSPVITEDLNRDDASWQAAESIVSQKLRAVVVIPLYAVSRLRTESVGQIERGHFLGALYLDSRRPAAFSALDRQILDAIAIEAASILDNARLVQRERERQRFEQELSIAREIQQALLPCGFRNFPHLEIVGTNLPCLEVGGDYFDIFPLGNQRTAFLIADISGKGLGAALLTTMLQGALSGMNMGVDPAGVFNYMNRFLCDHSEVGRYATMFFGILDWEGNFEFINAGHPSPLLLRSNEVAEPFCEGGFPVGLIPDASYSVCKSTLNPGDTLVLFSDGITEAMDPNEQLFGTPRLRDLLVGQQSASLDTLQKTILEAVREFSHGANQADDITVLLARYRGPGSPTAI